MTPDQFETMQLRKENAVFYAIMNAMEYRSSLEGTIRLTIEQHKWVRGCKEHLSKLGWIPVFKTSMIDDELIELKWRLKRA